MELIKSNTENNNEDVLIVESESAIQAHDIIINNEDDTMGNILATHMYYHHTNLYVGYKLPHYHKEHIILRLQYENEEMTVDNTRRRLAKACNEIIKVFENIQTEWESLF